MGLLWTEIHEQKHYPQTVTQTVTEKRAPTDDSIQLLKELEEAAEKRIIDKILVDTNVVKYSLVFSQDFLRYKLYLKIKINDYVYEETFSVNEIDDGSKLMDEIQKWVAEKIVMEPLREICTAYASGQQNNYRVIGDFSNGEKNEKISTSPFN